MIYTSPLVQRTLLFTALIAIPLSCNNTKKGSSAEHGGPTEVDYLIHQTNEAWTNAEVINQRVSPPRSALGSSGNGLEMAIHYSAPSVKHRTIYDSLVPYGQVWRTGANEATIVELSHDVHMGEKHIKSGKYALFTIPREKEWTLILNSVADQWGAFEYDSALDVARFQLTVSEIDPPKEELVFSLTNDANEDLLLGFAWSNRGFAIPVRKADDMP
jgi:hypothetical protein